MNTLINSILLGTLILFAAPALAVMEWSNEETKTAVIYSYKEGRSQTVPIKRALQLRGESDVSAVVALVASKNGRGKVKAMLGDSIIARQSNLNPSLEPFYIPLQGEDLRGQRLQLRTTGNVVVHTLIAIIEGGEHQVIGSGGSRQLQEALREIDRLRDELAAERRQARREEERRAERRRQKREKESKQCIARNQYGSYAAGGGCNQYGCYYKGGDCNQYGCYYKGGSCNQYGCIKRAPSTSKACE